MLDARIVGGALDPAAEYARFLARAGDAGAVTTFVGIARAATRSGDAVQRLYLDHHPNLSEASVHEIAATAVARFDLSAVTAVHRHGEVLPGEPIVFVAAASLHRRAAFQAADFIMDRLKTEAVFWKREDSASGSLWVEPTETDYEDRARWSE